MPTYAVDAMTPDALLSTPESQFPIGSQAKLFAPTPVDRGAWVEPRLVDTFVKTPNGRWTSYPGNDVNYPTLAALALATPIQEVFTPGQGEIVDGDLAMDQEPGYSMGTLDEETTDQPDQDVSTNPATDYAGTSLPDVGAPVEPATRPRLPWTKKQKITAAAIGVAVVGGLSLFLWFGTRKKR